MWNKTVPYWHSEKGRQIEASKIENECQKGKIINISKENSTFKLSPSKSKTVSTENITDKKVQSDYKCDRCEYSTNRLGILVKH